MMDVKLHDRGSRAMRLLSNQPPWGKPCSWVWPVVANTWSLGYLRLEWLESKSVQNGVPASFPGTADYSLRAAVSEVDAQKKGKWLAAAIVIPG